MTLSLIPHYNSVLLVCLSSIEVSQEDDFELYKKNICGTEAGVNIFFFLTNV